MRDYELMVVMHPTIADEEMPPALERVASVITGFGGEVDEPQTEHPWGRRRLAYPINDQTEAYYAVYKVKLQPSQAIQVDRELKLNDDVMRFLVTRPDEDNRPVKIADDVPEPVEREADESRRVDG